MTLIGERVGAIRVLEALGEGGMGRVYVGFDEKLQREVALKAIRGDRLEGGRRERLLYEARVLSQLDHPNVCRIYDLVESGGRDYLVLERVRGRSLRSALDRSSAAGLEHGLCLSVAEQVAEALVAAHAKGIVHRDLKPENVMLTDDGTVKVLDFGLARAFDSEPPPPAAGPDPGTEGEGSAGVPWLPSSHVETRHGSLVGTASCMSPEQARGERVTAASNMYSFGLLLQELFTGRPAYEPGLPFQVLVVKAAEGDTLPVEGVEADLTALIQRLKALSPEARPSAAEVVERLRFIRGKPGRRRRRLAAVAVALAFLAFGVKYVVDLRRERTAAVEARREAERVATFLVDLFEVSDPDQARGETITAREVLDRGAAELADELEEQPRIKARLLDTAGTVFRKLGLYERARPLLEEALELRRASFGEASPEVAASLHDLATLHAERARFAEAEPLFERALELRQRLLGAEDPAVAETLYAFGRMRGAERRFDEAEALLSRSLEIRERRPQELAPELADSLAALGSVHGARGETGTAGELFERSLDIRERVLPADHPDLANSLLGLAAVYNNQGRPAEAEPVLRRALAIQEKALGADHPRIALALRNLAALELNLRRPAEAETFARRSLAILEANLPAGDPSLARGLEVLAGALSDQGHGAEAEPLLRRAQEIREGSLGPDHLETVEGLRRLAARASERGDLGEAAEHLERARELSEGRLAADLESRDDRRRLAAILSDLGEIRRRLGEPERAREGWERALELVEELLAEPSDLEARAIAATCHLRLGAVGQARPLVEKLLAAGWDEPAFLALCREHGLAGAVASGAASYPTEGGGSSRR